MYNKVNFENYNMFFIDERLKDLKQFNMVLQININS